MIRNSGGYSVKEIGDYFGVQYSRVSKARKTKAVVKTSFDIPLKVNDC